MANPHEKWRDPKKEIPPKQLCRFIQPGSRIFIGSVCSEPTVLTEQLVKQKCCFVDCELVHFLTLSDNKFFDENEPSLFRHHALFAGNSMRDAVGQGKADYIPISLSDIPKLILSGRFRIDVALIQVSPPDEFGFCSLGINVDINRSVVQAAKLIIAQINPLMPRTTGDSFIRFEQIDHYHIHESELLEYSYPKCDEVARKIGCFCARIIENGSTLQVGIGNIPNAVLKHLEDKKDLAVYSEVLSDHFIDLFESGAVTCRKNIYPHVMTSFVMGTRRLYNFVDNNPFIEFRSTEYINNIVNIAKNHKLVSINAALSVSITGQVNSDSLGSKIYSGVSGQLDFTRGAAASRGGKPIICLPSTTRDGEISRIVARLEPGAGVVIPRSDVHYVITEWGMAFLHGKSIRDRVLQMIGIAHPKYRKQLLEEAKKMHFVYEDQMLPQTRDGVVVIYPDRYEWSYETKDCGTIFFRPVKPTDERQLQELYYQLNQDDRIMRFFIPKTTFTHRETQQSVNVDYDSTFVLVGLNGEDENRKMVAMSAYYLNRSQNIAEVAFTVTKEFRNQGIATHMTTKLIEIGKEKGIKGFFGEVLRDNASMMHVLKHLPYDVQLREGEGCLIFSFNWNGM